jgi:hypothetical protein
VVDAPLANNTRNQKIISLTAQPICSGYVSYQATQGFFDHMPSNSRREQQMTRALQQLHLVPEAA